MGRERWLHGGGHPRSIRKRFVNRSLKSEEIVKELLTML